MPSSASARTSRTTSRSGKRSRSRIPDTAGRRHDRARRPASAGHRSTGRPFQAPPGEPPVLVDPRRWGALVGVAGGLVFVLSYAPALGTVVHLVTAVLAVALALGVLVGLYVRPVPLGPLREPRRTALAVYGTCVVGELLLIALGSRLLTELGRPGLRPALIVTVVGLHFLPFAWAFGERHFVPLGTTLVVLGVAGLVVGRTVAPLAASGAAVLAGLVMLALLVGYARRRRDTGVRREGTV